MAFCEARCLMALPEVPCAKSDCLVEGAQTGDAEAREKLFALLAPFVLRLARRLCRGAGAAQDVAQLALLQILEHLADLRRPDRLGAWVRRIVTNAHRMEERRRAARIQGEDAGGAALPLPCEGEWRLDAKRELWRVLERAPMLPPLLAETFRLRVVEGLSTRQAAVRLGVSPEVVRARLARARKRLRLDAAPGA